jgi:hypothetical protein
MIPYIDLYNAKKSLAMAEETIRMMNDPDNYMLQAQKDMRQLEVEYYQQECYKFTVILLTLFIGFGIMIVLYLKGMLHVF